MFSRQSVVSDDGGKYKDKHFKSTDSIPVLRLYSEGRQIGPEFEKNVLHLEFMLELLKVSVRKIVFSWKKQKPIFNLSSQNEH